MNDTAFAILSSGIKTMIKRVFTNTQEFYALCRNNCRLHTDWKTEILQSSQK